MGGNISGDPWQLFGGGPRRRGCGVVSACRSAGLEPEIVHQLDDYPTR